MNILKALFSGPEMVGKTIGAIGDAVDDNVWSKEERATFVAKLYEAASPSALSRRLIAWAVVGLWGFSIILYEIGVVIEAAWRQDIYKLISDDLTEPTTYVLGFYFLVRALGALKQ